MKANAPEKIYVCIPDDDIVGTASTQKGFPHQFVTEEYTQTNAFIEKATSYIQQHWIWNTKMIGDFRKYMEGE